MREKWEYHMKQIHPHHMGMGSERILNRLGNDRWELVGLIPIQGTDKATGVFRREKEGGGVGKSEFDKMERNFNILLGLLYVIIALKVVVLAIRICVFFSIL
jgi:hypothetical protein